MFRKIIKALIPNGLLNRLREWRANREIYAYYKEDMVRYIDHSGVRKKLDNKIKVVAAIAMDCHIVEKGLTMPQMKFGYGYDMIHRLIGHCNRYLDRGYDLPQLQLDQAVGVLSEYVDIHKKSNFEIDKVIAHKIETLTSKVRSNEDGAQLSFDAESYFKDTESSFDRFSSSRHSLRHLKGSVSTQQIIKAVDLAKNAPSSCNRQPSRVYIVEHEEKIKQILEQQQGHRGFGHLADKLLVVTAEIGIYNSVVERNSAYIDGGMFGMNLLYSLHYHRIGACTLNCYFTTHTEQKVRDILGMPQSEVAIFILILGGVPKEFKVACSKRSKVDDIVKTV